MISIAASLLRRFFIGTGIQQCGFRDYFSEISILKKVLHFVCVCIYSIVYGIGDLFIYQTTVVMTTAGRGYTPQKDIMHGWEVM